MIRIYTALSILEGAPQGLTVKELTERLEVRDVGANKRTVCRDLEALSTAQTAAQFLEIYKRRKAV